MARQIVVDIIGDASRFNKATKDAVNNTEGFGSSLKHSAVAGAAAGLAFGAVDKAIGFVTDAIGGASEAAKEDTASQDRLKLAYDNTGKAQKLSVDQIEAIISANQAKGASDSEQRQGISDFLDLTNDANEAMRLNAAVLDLAAAKGISYADAEGIIKSAASGRTAALAKAGVEVQKGASITEIATKVNDKFGGSLDRVSKTQSGKASIANEKMGEAMERVGRIINKVAEVALPVLADAMTWVVDNVMPPLEQGFSWLAKNVFPKVAAVVQALAPVFKTVFGIISTIIGKWLDVVGTIIGVVSRVAGKVGDVFRTMAGVIHTIFGGIASIVKGAFNGVIDAINWVIGMINGIQVHVHVGPVNLDWNGLNLARLPRFHTGGVVPGVSGEEMLAVLQAGERVIPRNAAGSSGQEIHIHIEEGAWLDGPALDMLTNKIAQRLQFAAGT